MTMQVTNTTTELERFARTLGFAYSIRLDEQHPTSKYFLVADQGTRLADPLPLGLNRKQARLWLKEKFRQHLPALPKEELDVRRDAFVENVSGQTVGLHKL